VLVEIADLRRREFTRGPHSSMIMGSGRTWCRRRSSGTHSDMLGQRRRRVTRSDARVDVFQSSVANEENTIGEREVTLDPSSAGFKRPTLSGSG
jgi:hypothetical protein